MSKKNVIYINYFIQNDSWENLTEPNLYVLPGEYPNLNNVKAQNIYESFPLRDKFNYYLRFYLDDKTQNVKGWIDFPPEATVPVYNKGSVYVKALRIPKGVKINFKNKEIFQSTKKKRKT